MDPLPFYRSPVFIGGVVSLVSHLVALFGLHVSDEVITTNVQAVFQVISLLALAYAGYKRWRSQVQPLSLTNKGKSDAKPPAPPAAPTPPAA